MQTKAAAAPPPALATAPIITVVKTRSSVSRKWIGCYCTGWICVVWKFIDGYRKCHTIKNQFSNLNWRSTQKAAHTNYFNNDQASEQNVVGEMEREREANRSISCGNGNGFCVQCYWTGNNNKLLRHISIIKPTALCHTATWQPKNDLFSHASQMKCNITREVVEQ